MDDITKELDQMAENMEKSNQTQEFDLNVLKATVLKLGPEGLKKALPKLSAEHRAVLKDFLEDMQKSHRQLIAKDRPYTLEPESNSTPGGDYKYNEDEKQPFDHQDEVLVAEAKKRDQATPRNQGGTPVEGWEGQVIKGAKLAKDEEGSAAGGEAIMKTEDCDPKAAKDKKPKEAEADMEKGGSGSGRHKVNPALAGLESVKRMSERQAEVKQVQGKQSLHKEEPGTEGGEVPALKKEAPMKLDEKKKAAKNNLQKMMKRMQERKMEKSMCCSKLATVLEVDESKISQIWDLMEKAYKMTAPAEAAKQNDVPAQMKSDEGGKVSDKAEPSVPAYKDKSAKKPGDETSPGSATETADKTIKKVPETMGHKGDMAKGFYHEEDEVYLAKSAANPFAVRSTGQNAAYKVDELIELQEASKTARLAKSKFDYRDEDADDKKPAKGKDKKEEPKLEKGDAEEAQAAQVTENGKAERQAAKDAKDEVKDIKINEKLSRIESHGGPKMPFVKKMKKSYVDDLIEKSLDMDLGTIEAAQANRTRQDQGAFLVKSFADDEMEALFGEQDMWKSDKKA